MPSPARADWTIATEALEQLDAAHHAVGGVTSGRRTNTLQLNYAFVLLLSAHFQAFCRDLHSQAAQKLVEALPTDIGAVLGANLTANRQLDSKNAQPGSIGADFHRLGFVFWSAVNAVDARNARSKEKLEQLNEWRNAVAHHDIARRRANLAPREVTLDACGDWRSALNGLAAAFDRVVADHVETLVGTTLVITSFYMAKTASTTPPPPLNEGTHVRVRAGDHVFPAVVLEDRGAFGAGGMHILRVAVFPDDPDQRAEFEVSEDRLELEAA